MEALQNPKHEIFAQHRAAGKPYGEAYTLAGYKGDAANACNLAKRKDIIERVQYIQGLALDAALITKERVLTEIASIAFAPSPPPPIKMSDKLEALAKLAKHLGLTSDRLDVHVDIGLADLVNGSYKLEPPKIIEGTIVNATNEQEKPNDIKGE